MKGTIRAAGAQPPTRRVYERFTINSLTQAETSPDAGGQIGVEAMGLQDSRAKPQDFAIGTTVAIAVLSVLFGFVTFSEAIVSAVY